MSIRFANLAAICVAALLTTVPALAGIVAPYSTDANTLHLWHMDESANNIEDYGYTDANDIDTQVVGATLGATAYSGFGTAVSAPGRSTDIVTAVSQPVSQSQLQGADGAFTYEAMIKVSSLSEYEDQVIIALANGEGYADQAFQFRISSGNLQFIQVKPSVTVVQAAIPTTGDNAWSADQWYHVAVSYTGAEGVADNTKLYWTKVSGGASQASLLTSGMLSSDITSSQTNYLAIANRYAQGSTLNGEDGLGGLIDEVRVSDIARGPGDFIFSVPEPSSFALLGMALVGLLAYAWRKRR